MIAKICHEILNLYYARVAESFHSTAHDLEFSQRHKLEKIIQSLGGTTQYSSLTGKSYEELCDLLPVVTYSDLRSKIEVQRQTGAPVISASVVRYEPTSGSTESRKWIPYSRNFLNEINLAAAAWMGDIYTRIPQVRRGTHYWSMSWLPEDLRSQATSNDADLFPAYQRWILKKSMAVPAEISEVAQPKAAWWATLHCLGATEDLTLVSVWSPTFWLKITADLKALWPQISENLQQGTWGDFEPDILPFLGKAPKRNLKSVCAEQSDFFKRLWPNLSVISAWDSSSSSFWADQIKSQFQDVIFQGKGVWATEGVVSIPFQNQKALAFQSHFFEFIDFETGEILPAWKLKLNCEYQPVLWTSSGLLRYALQDRIKVVSFLKQVPCFEFQGRLLSVDLVGEKIDAQWVQNLFAENPHWRAISLIASRKPTPKYFLCHQSTESISIETELLKLHHYKVARELGQLEMAESCRIDNVFDLWEMVGKSRIVGQNKVEILQEVNTFPAELFNKTVKN